MCAPRGFARLLTDIDRAAALLRAPFLKQDVILAAVRSPGNAVARMFLVLSPRPPGCRPRRGFLAEPFAATCAAR
ncbi:MAG: hypothetical protein EBS42_01545 [Caulobacteraceae bacterium]|nr:hypothetical protein [Caulobacteraceae bacterium]